MVISFDSVPTGNIHALVHSQGFKDGLHPLKLPEGQMLDLNCNFKENNPQNNKSSITTLIERFWRR
jgi:hypothetical protein